MRILLVEDEPHLAAAVRDHLVADGETVDWCALLMDADAALRSIGYGLVVLDLHMPDGRGIDFLRDMRKRGDGTPVLIASARDQISDRIEGLDAGADDYLVKPYDLDEMIARIGAIKRRYSGTPSPVLKLGSFAIDTVAKRVARGDEDIPITRREWAILDALLRRANAVLSKEQLEDVLYAFGEDVNSNAVEVHISRLRGKLGRETIRTVRGVGYSIPR
jgi:two-component system, OmpR family, response regulator